MWSTTRLPSSEWAVAVRVSVLCVGLYVTIGTAIASGQQPEASATPSDHFGRMFNNLPPFAPQNPRVMEALIELGRPGGLMDANDDLDAGAFELIVNPLLNLKNPNNDAHTAGVTFMGQFLDHDMTFDTTSRLGQPANPRTSRNSRRPYFDLDSVYGDGPVGSPLLYEASDRAKLKVESNGPFEDLPRDVNGTALIADPRNDENLVISGLQAAFLLFHNRVVDLIRDQHPAWESEDVFREARRLTTWHYQWMILHEFLPAFTGTAMVDDVLANGCRFYQPEEGRAFIPVEFQMAYRFGHSMVRPSYRANFTGNFGGAFFAMLFEEQSGSGEPSDLRGGFRSPRRFVGWQTFFRFPGFESDVRPNKRLDTKLSTPLFDLPLGAIASGAPPTSLAARNLLRHLTWKLPSGQMIAEAMGAPVLTAAQLADLQTIYPPFVTSTPLWFYVLREADILGHGAQLGPVGGRIVAEVFIGLLQADPDSFLNQEPLFTPTLGESPGSFTMIDFLRVAGVSPRR
jgi:Animal haem peroxidase